MQSLESRVLLSLDPIGPQFNIAESFGAESNPAVVDAYGNGDFVMAWQSYEDIDAVMPTGDDSGFGIYAGRFDETGTLQGSVIQVNTFEIGDQLNPAIAADANGNFVVVWQSRNTDDPAAAGYDIYYQVFDSMGAAIGAETRANETVLGDQVNAGVAMDADGDFMIVWQGPDAGGAGIYGRGFDETGAAQGGEFLINTITDGDQLNPAVDAQNTADGIFVVAWHGPGETVVGEEASVEVWVNVFSNDLYPAAGSRTALATELQANVTLEHDQNLADVAVDADGDFVVVWQTEGITGSGSDVFGRLFDFAALPAPDIGTVTPVTGDFQVNTTTAQGQRSAAVDMDDAGNFFVSWQSSHQDGFSWGIFGQAYNAAGTAVGTEVSVNTQVEGPQTQPDVGIAPGGETIVTWLGREPVIHDFGVHGQRFANAGQTRVGDELFLVSAIAIEDDAPGVASDANGNFVAVWQSYDEDGSGLGIFGRLYAANGTPLSAPFLVNTTTLGNQSHPDVARAPGGQFVVVWQTDTTTGEGHEIVAQLFDENGNKIGPEIIVNTTHAGDQAWPAVAMDAAGNFIVVWEGAAVDGSRDVYYQRFDAAGVPIGTEVQVNTEIALDQFMPSVAMNAAGEFVIAWVSDHPAADPMSLDTEKTVFVQKYDAAGNVLGAPGDTLVNQFTEEAQEFPAVAIDASGNFVVVWQAINHPDEGGGGSWGVFARRFDRLKNPLGDEFLVNQVTAAPQRFPAIAMNRAGNFLISWQSQNQDASSWGIFAREYSADGTAVSDEFLVNTFGEGPQILPAVTWTPAGTVVIVWEGRGSDPTPEPHGSGAIEGVHARIYQTGVPSHRIDFNGDGLEDVAEMKFNGEWWVGLSNGTDAFTEELWTKWVASSMWAHVDFGDFNSDGLTDIVGLTNSGGVWVALSNGANGFHIASRWLNPQDATKNLAHVGVGDFDGNGYSDIAGFTSDGKWNVALSTSAASFALSTVPWDTWADQSNWADIEFGDFNDDGFTDVAGFTQWGGWWVGLNNALGSVGSPDAGRFTHSQWAKWVDASHWADLEIGDFNGDGSDDIAGMDISGNWWIGTSNATAFNTGPLSADWATLPSWGKIGLGDFNDDGFADLAGFSIGGGWWVGLNNTTGGFNTSRWALWQPVANWAQLDLLDVTGSEDVPPDEAGATDVVGFYQNGDWRVGVSNGTDALVGDAFWADWDPADNWATLNDALTLQRRLDRLALV